MRQKLLKDLARMRAQGWEKDILPYGQAFDETKANNSQLLQHVHKIRKHRNQVINDRMAILCKILAFILLFLMILFK